MKIAELIEEGWKDKVYNTVTAVSVAGLIAGGLTLAKLKMELKQAQAESQEVQSRIDKLKKLESELIKLDK